MKKGHLYFLVIILTTLFSCNSDKTENTTTSTSKLVGTWKLIEYSDFDTVTKKWNHPYGEHPRGYFTYTNNGIVNLNVSSEEPLIVPADSEYLKPLTLGAVLDNAFGYFGTYTIDSLTSIVTHHVKGGSVINYIGTDQQRQFKISGDTLLIGDPTFKTGRRILVKE